MYKMQDAERVDQNSQILLVKRVDITFDDQECQMLTFVNITSLHQFKKEQEKSRILQALNTSLHHEMLAPLGTNVMIAERLMK